MEILCFNRFNKSILSKLWHWGRQGGTSQQTSSDIFSPFLPKIVIPWGNFSISAFTSIFGRGKNCQGWVSRCFNHCVPCFVGIQNSPMETEHPNILKIQGIAEHRGFKAPNYSSSLGGLVILAAREFLSLPCCLFWGGFFFF